MKNQTSKNVSVGRANKSEENRNSVASKERGAQNEMKGFNSDGSKQEMGEERKPKEFQRAIGNGK